MTNDHALKFLFLIALVGAMLFSRAGYPAASTADGTVPTGGAANVAGQRAVPRFDMRAASISANDDPPPASPASPPATTTPEASSKDAPPALAAVASLATDLRGGTIFESMNADRRWPTASLTKLMTATIVEDKLDLRAKITVTDGMLAFDPTEQALVANGTYTVADLLRALLLPSSNVAAEALAGFYGRGMFLGEMNARASAWGMTNTYFGDPSGLSASNQSTANDFLKLAQKIYTRYPQIFAITRLVQAAITEGNSGKSVLVKNINDFAGRADFVGGKTGYTDEAAGNLLTVLNDNGRPVLVVVLGTSARFHDTDMLYSWVRQHFR